MQPTTSNRIPTFKAGDIIYVGNQDNLGFMLMKYARARGLRAWLVIQGRGIRRSDPDYFEAGLTEKYKNYIFDHLAFKQILKAIKTLKGLNIFATGIETMYMLKESNDSNNYYMIPTGSDLAMWPFVDESTASTKVYLEYREIFYKYRFRLKKIFTSQLDCIYAATALGLKDRIRSWNYPAPIEYIEKRNHIFLKEFEDPEKAPEKRIIFLPCRKNGDFRYTNYKGAQILLKGIEYFAKEATNTILRNTFILNIHQGNESQSYGVEDFKNDIQNISAQYKLNVIHIRDLEASEFWSFLKDPRMAVVDEFGQFNGLMGGIGREASCCGRPVLTGTISTSDQHTSRIYGKAAPIYTAYSAKEIGKFILEFCKLSNSELRQKSEEISEWALSVFNPDKAYNEIIDVITKEETYKV